MEPDPQWRWLATWPFGALYVLAAMGKRLGRPDVISEPRASRKVDGAVERTRLALGPRSVCPQGHTLLGRAVVA